LKRDFAKTRGTHMMICERRGDNPNKSNHRKALNSKSL